MIRYERCDAFDYVRTADPPGDHGRPTDLLHDAIADIRHDGRARYNAQRVKCWLQRRKREGPEQREHARSEWPRAVGWRSASAEDDGCGFITISVKLGAYSVSMISLTDVKQAPYRLNRDAGCYLDHARRRDALHDDNRRMDHRLAGHHPVEARSDRLRAVADGPLSQIDGGGGAQYYLCSTTSLQTRPDTARNG